MIYMGSKSRIAKELLEVMLKGVPEDTYFIDCFTGGGNLVQYCNQKNIIASDINPYVIAFLKRIQKEGCNWLPKNNERFKKENWQYIKDNKDKFNNSVLGHCGYNLSYGGKWFNSFRSDKVGKRDYVAEAYRGACKQADLLRNKNIDFICCSYDELSIPVNSVIYCDIPYKGTGKYEANKDSFDYDKFYNWCKYKAIEGHKIYVSEYSMPEPFECVWDKQIKVQIAKNDNSTNVSERLFTLK